MLRKSLFYLRNPLIFFHYFICKIRSAYYSRLIDTGKGKIIISEPFLPIVLKKGKNSKLVLNGNLTIQSHISGKNAVIIDLEENAKLEIAGDFVLGNGVKIYLCKNSELFLGGQDKESASGITADSLIMVNKKIIIGKDFLCAWGVFITDSDWHTILGQKHQSNVIIGDHVWIANNSNVLRGSIIGNNCIVAGQSKVINKEYPDNVMIAGAYGKVVKTDIAWSRDIY